MGPRVPCDLPKYSPSASQRVAPLSILDYIDNFHVESAKHILEQGKGRVSEGTNEEWGVN